MQKTVTIGVAVCNVEQYLPACLDSVIRQKGDDIEIILVDDGSKDSSGQICDTYAAKDARVRVIHKENGGASTARNAIIEAAQGDWICFVDGDDMLTDDALETVRKHLSDEYPIIFFDAIYFKYENAVSPYTVDLPNMELTGDMLKKFALQTIYAGSDAYDFVNKPIITPWGKVYNRAFLLENGLRYEPAARKGQDLVFSIYCLPYLQKTLLVRAPIYLYRINDNSISNRYSEKITEQINNVVSLLVERILNHGEMYDDDCVQRFYARCIVCIKSTSELYFFHKSNKKSFKEREAEFLVYIAQPWCVQAIQNCDVSMLTRRNAVLYGLIAAKDVKGLDRYFGMRAKYNAVKDLLHRMKLLK